MLSLSMAALFDGFIQADRIFENISQGLENIKQQVPPAPAKGEITSVNNVVEGRKEIWGFTLDWFASRAYSEVTIMNTGNTTTTYDLYATYNRSFTTTDLWWVPEWLERTYYLPIIVKEQIELAPGESKTITLEYLNESGGSIPPGNIVLYLVGRDNSGVYGLDMEATNFGTTFITQEGEIIPEDKAKELRVHQYPVRSEVQYMPETGNYILTIYVSNPFESPIAAELYQELPTGVDAISTENGVSDQDSISWELRLAAGERRLIQVVLQAQGEGAKIEVPGAIITIYDRINNK
ncbi:hypothetical protein M1N83_01625 [Dehalococcoidia bacterium]|nr:hypothetical protein [Dehalococcoidia bacterium]